MGKSGEEEERGDEEGREGVEGRREVCIGENKK